MSLAFIVLVKKSSTQRIITIYFFFRRVYNTNVPIETWTWISHVTPSFTTWIRPQRQTVTIFLHYISFLQIPANSYKVLTDYTIGTAKIWLQSFSCNQFKLVFALSLSIHTMMVLIWDCLSLRSTNIEKVLLLRSNSNDKRIEGFVEL